MNRLLEIADLDIRFDTPDGEVHAVRKASLAIEPGQCLGAGLGRRDEVNRQG